MTTFIVSENNCPSFYYTKLAYFIYIADVINSLLRITRSESPLTPVFLSRLVTSRRCLQREVNSMRSRNETAAVLMWLHECCCCNFWLHKRKSKPLSILFSFTKIDNYKTQDHLRMRIYSGHDRGRHAHPSSGDDNGEQWPSGRQQRTGGCHATRRCRFWLANLIGRSVGAAGRHLNKKTLGWRLAWPPFDPAHSISPTIRSALTRDRSEQNVPRITSSQPRMLTKRRIISLRGCYMFMFIAYRFLDFDD